MDEDIVLEDHRPLDGVGQLADIARPVVVLEQLPRVAGEALNVAVHGGAAFFQQQLGEGQDAGAALPQGGQADRQDVDTVIEVFAELPPFHLPHEVLVGGGDDAHVAVDGLVAADPLEGLLLQHAQQLGLQTQVHLTDLVEEDGAAAGLLEAADALLVGAGEGAFLVAEEFRLEEVLGDVGAVDLDEGLLAARRVEVHRAGEERLAGAGVAGDEDGRVGLGEAFQALEDLLHVVAVGDDVLEVVDHVLLAAVVGDLETLVADLDGLVEGDVDARRRDGVDEKIAGPVVHRLDDDLGLLHPADGDNRQEGVLAVDLGDQLHHPGLATVEVEEDEVELPGPHLLLEALLLGVAAQLAAVAERVVHCGSGMPEAIVDKHLVHCAVTAPWSSGFKIVIPLTVI